MKRGERGRSQREGGSQEQGERRDRSRRSRSLCDTLYSRHGSPGHRGPGGAAGPACRSVASSSFPRVHVPCAGGAIVLGYLTLCAIAVGGSEGEMGRGRGRGGRGEDKGGKVGEREAAEGRGGGGSEGERMGKE
eukprot:765333-Hanusia_phi.AAC.2